MEVHEEVVGKGKARPRAMTTRKLSGRQNTKTASSPRVRLGGNFEGLTPPFGGEGVSEGCTCMGIWGGRGGKGEDDQEEIVKHFVVRVGVGIITVKTRQDQAKPPELGH